MQKLIAIAVTSALIAHAADARNLGTSRLDRAATWGEVTDGNQGKNGKANGNAGGTKPVVEEPVVEEPVVEEPVVEEPVVNEPVVEEPVS